MKSFGAGSITVTSLPFGRTAQVTVSGDGFYFGASDTYEIGYYSSAGRLERLIRVDRPNLQVTAGDRDRYATERLESASEEWRPHLQQMLDEMRFPDEMPAYSTILTDAEGHLWVADYRAPGDERGRWSAFDQEGGLLGSVETPPRFSIYDIGSDYVLGGQVDDLDVKRVRL